MKKKIPKKKIPKVLEYITEIRKVLKEAMDKIESLSRQMVTDTGVKIYNIEHVIFLFSLALEDLRKAKIELEKRLK